MTEETHTAAELRAQYEALMAQATELQRSTPAVLRKIQDEAKAKFQAHQQAINDLVAEKGRVHLALVAAEKAEAEAAAIAAAEPPPPSAFDEQPEPSPEPEVQAEPQAHRPTRRQRGG